MQKLSNNSLRKFERFWNYFIYKLARKIESFMKSLPQSNLIKK